LAFAAPACLLSPSLSLSLYIENSSTPARGKMVEIRIENSSTPARGKMVEIRTFASGAVKLAGECSGDLCASTMRPAASLLQPDDLPIDDACSSDEPPPPIEKTADTPLCLFSKIRWRNPGRLKYPSKTNMRLNNF
jgi:hypothetical protein